MEPMQFGTIPSPGLLPSKLGEAVLTHFSKSRSRNSFPHSKQSSIACLLARMRRHGSFPSRFRHSSLRTNPHRSEKDFRNAKTMPGGVHPYPVRTASPRSFEAEILTNLVIVRDSE